MSLLQGLNLKWMTGGTKMCIKLVRHDRFYLKKRQLENESKSIYYLSISKNAFADWKGRSDKYYLQYV